MSVNLFWWKLFFLVIICLIQTLIQMFSVQLLTTFYLLKDLKNRLFNENKKFLNKVMNQFILYLLHQLLALFVDFYSYFLRIYFVPGYPYYFRCLLIVFFNITVYDIIYILKKKKNLSCCFYRWNFWIPRHEEIFIKFNYQEAATTKCFYPMIGDHLLRRTFKWLLLNYFRN